MCFFFIFFSLFFGSKDKGEIGVGLMAVLLVIAVGLYILIASTGE